MYPTEFLKRHSLVIGILLMFLLTWPIDLANSRLLPFQFPFVIYLFLGYGFIFASLIMTGLALGKDAVITLLKRFLIWRVGWKWYLVALLLFPAVETVAVMLNAALTQTPADFSRVVAYKVFGESANLALFIVPFFLIDAVSNGEEMGWRGYVLPRLQAKYSALASSLIVGLIWGFWHFPKFLAEGWDGSLLWYMVATMAKAVLFTWLYNNTKGSLLLVTFFHAASNLGIFLPIANTAEGQSAYITAIILEVIAAVVVTVIAGPARLSRTEPKQIQE